YCSRRNCLRSIGVINNKAVASGELYFLIYVALAKRGASAFPDISFPNLRHQWNWRDELR
ncbi:MAG TPA: hypothetical protein PKN48_13650, partial [Bacteroidales bacterium]|nr:hypothetical protein [Bacteroidales bacterium]